jgi:hypothetical protein
MNKLKKSLAVAVILLFISVAVAPSINVSVVKASNDNDLIEVTSEACGMKGFGNQTVKLTKQQYQNLEQYLVEFRARLNQTSTREEAVPIFKEAVVELNKYGLLPKGMSVEKAQSLVVGQNQNKRIMKLQERLLHTRLFSQDNNSNYLCLIAGNTDHTGIIGLLPVVTVTSSLAIAILNEIVMTYFPNLKILTYSVALFVAILFFSGLLSYFLPATLFSVITLGWWSGSFGYEQYTPSNGWVRSIGSMGMKMWEGALYGRLRYIVLPTGGVLTYIGAIGFAGIKLGLFGHRFYLGSALVANIGPSPP